MRTRVVGAALLALVAGCHDPREAELAQELAHLHESRVARDSLDRMRAEADSGAAAVAAAEAALEAERGAVEKARREGAAAEASARAEIDRNGALNREIQAGQQGLQEAGARLADLEQQLAIRRARAQDARDQADVLARELRPDDPDWARRLHIQSLREFLGQVAQAWPGDPVLAELARRDLPTDASQAARLGAELAARVRDHLAEVYGLGAAGTASGTPAVAAGPDAS